MSSTIQYKGYIGSVEFSEEDRILYGKVKGIRSLISCEGSTAEELIHDFHEAVDEYLSFCESSGKSPEMPFKGSFNVGISPNLHRAVYRVAEDRGMSMNHYIETVLKAACEREECLNTRQSAVSRLEDSIEKNCHK